MSIPTAAAKLPSPPAGSEDVIGVAKAAGGGFDGTFEGTVEKDGIYPGTLVEMKAKTSPNAFKPGEMKDEIVWGFELDDQKGKGYLPWRTSYSLHEKSKLPKTAETCGHPLKDGESVKKADFLGAKVNLLIELVDNRDKTKKYARITKLIAR